VEVTAWVAGEPGPNLGVLSHGAVVQDDVDGFAFEHFALDRVEETHELLVSVALHVPADHCAVEGVERGEQRGGAVALLVMRHRTEAPTFHR
jgi:hypothetical protein